MPAFQPAPRFAPRPSLYPLLLARAFYFVYWGAVGCFVPFLNLYFEQVGLSGSAIGVLAALTPLMLLVAGPLWGAIGDRFRIHRHLLPLAALGTILPVLLMTQTVDFGWLAILVLWSAFFSTPIVPLIDSAVLDLVPGTGQSYGSIRLWGSIGFTVMTWLWGYVLRWQGLLWLFYGYAGLLFLAGLLALRLPGRREQRQSEFWSGVRHLLRQRALMLFLAGQFLTGATLQASYSFYPLYLVALGGDEAWIGLSGALGAISEMPVLWLSALLLRHLSVRGTVILGHLTFALRWGVLAAASTPLLALLTSAFHGLSFGPFLVGGVAFVESHTPPGLHATAQGLLGAVSFGLGAAAGALVGGWLYDVLGPGGLFAVGGAAALLAAVAVASARN